MLAECDCILVGALGSFCDKLLVREGVRSKRDTSIRQCIRLYRASASDAQRARHYECSLCFHVPSPRTLPCTVLSSSCSEQHVNCCFTISTNVSKLQPRQRAKPQPWPGVCGQMECEPRVRKKRGSNNEASPLCWLFVWTDRLSRSTSCGRNTNVYD